MGCAGGYFQQGMLINVSDYFKKTSLSHLISIYVDAKSLCLSKDM